MKHIVFGTTLALLTCTSAQAALLSRAGGQAYYDTDQDITWLKDANYAATSGFDSDGAMIKGQVDAWIASLNAANHLGVSDWRLPATVQPDPNCSFQSSGVGYGINCWLSELPYLYLGYGVWNGSPGPFTNVRAHYYWSGTPTGSGTYFVWGAHNAQQLGSGASTNAFYGWAVRDGDIGATPDADGDGVADAGDNCVAVANADQADADGDLRGNACDNCRTKANNTGAAAQCDSDADGYGNHCDGDFNQNGATNSQDYVLFRQQIGQPSIDPTFNSADINCNGAVNAQDYVLLRGMLGLPPGPGAGP